MASRRRRRCDIDSGRAWDTTGGTAANGSRIVVAVLEGGGSNYNHVDLIDNHWVNSAEIPDNGIDDDLNGFVDDYNGWNATNNTDNISAGGHGTSVSGMIGATGNNGIGGVGVNWDVDIMQVQMGGLTESNVIAAYNYPYEMRALFNETGDRRAFVVGRMRVGASIWPTRRITLFGAAITTTLEVSAS